MRCKFRIHPVAACSKMIGLLPKATLVLLSGCSTWAFPSGDVRFLPLNHKQSTPITGLAGPTSPSYSPSISNTFADRLKSSLFKDLEGMNRDQAIAYFSDNGFHCIRSVCHHASLYRRKLDEVRFVSSFIIVDLFSPRIESMADFTVTAASEMFMRR